jgi:hypothetical protein
MSDARTYAQIAAQIAVEAVINDPDDYEGYAIHAVYENGIANGVSDFYLRMIQK